MSTTTIIPTAFSPPLYRSETGWPPFRAALMTVVILILAAGLGFAVLIGGAAIADPSLAILEGHGDLANGIMLFSQLVMQFLCVALTFWAARFYDRNPRQVLALRPVPGGAGTYVKAFVFLSIISGAFSAFAWEYARNDIVTDLHQLWPLLQGKYWWLLLLVAVIGAPLSEEIVFRGFLQSALAKSPFGFWGGAILSNSAWTGLHAGYTTTGLTDVFLAGLVFSWLLWRTGSLWVPIVCHGLYNGLVFAVLFAFDFGQLAQGTSV